MLTPNTLLHDRYLILNLLGQGGMGAVYQATDKKFGNDVALKETFYNDLNLRVAFSHEAKLLNRLRHAALPVVTDYFADGDRQFLVMQYIPGKDLEQWLHDRLAGGYGPFPTSQVLSWGDQLLDALEYLHAQNPPIIHRDIKPQNLKLTPRGEIILLDFGLAKGTGEQSSRASRSIRGYTPNYASLEQIRGTGTTPCSDIYSIGATLYHLVTGEMPQDAMTRVAAILMGQPDPLKPISSLNGEVPSGVVTVIEKAMSTHAENRFASAALMRQALRNAKRDVQPESFFRTPTLTDELLLQDFISKIPNLKPDEDSAHLRRDEDSARLRRDEDSAHFRRGEDSARLRRDEGSVHFRRDEDSARLRRHEGSAHFRRDEDSARLRRNDGSARLRWDEGSAHAIMPADEAPPDVNRNSIESESGKLDSDVDQATSGRVPKAKSAGSRKFYTTLALLLIVTAVSIGISKRFKLDRIIMAGAAELFSAAEAGLRRSGGIPMRVETLRYYLEIDPGEKGRARVTGLMPLVAGSRFKFHFMPRQSGYLYIIALGQNSAWQTFLTNQPMQGSGVYTNQVVSGREYQFPGGGQWFMLQRDAETTPFTVIFSPVPLTTPGFLSLQSGRDLSEAERGELASFKQQYAMEAAELIAVENQDQPAVSVHVSTERPTGDPLIFEISLKRKNN